MTMLLDLNELTWLSQAFASSTPLSPFTYISGETSGKEGETLAEKGILREDGSITPEHLPMLETLSQADRYVQIAVYEEGLAMKRTHLYAKAVDASMVPVKDQLLFSQPADKGKVKVSMANLLGSSRIANLNWSVVLKPEAMQVLAVLCDLYRESVLGKVPVEGSGAFAVDSAAIRKRLDGTHDPRHAMAARLEQTAVDVPEALEQLAGFELVRLENGQVHLSEALCAFAYRHLLVDKRIEVALGQLEGDTVKGSAFTVVQSGANDLYVLEFSSDAVSLATPSAYEVEGILARLLENGPAL